jgi:predicted ArsR family transcriptional regulator
LLARIRVEKFLDLRNTSVVKTTTFSQIGESTHERTREVIVRTVLEFGPSTATALANRLAITPAGVRRHLEALVEEGIFFSRDEYQSPHAGPMRGRPAKVFAVTEVGREKFAHAYDDLAISALKFMESEKGPSAISKFAKVRAEELKNKILIGRKEKKITADELANSLKELGFAASAHHHEHGAEICQRHCPVANVASAFPQICEAETEMFSELLGSHVQRLATIAHGEGVCTTYIPDLVGGKGRVPIRKNASASNSTARPNIQPNVHPNKKEKSK